MISSATSVSDYLRRAPAPQRATLRRLRTLIRKAVPDARELMKYGHPHYELRGSLFALASQKHYVSLYVAETDVVERWRADLPGLSIGRSCIRMRQSVAPPFDVLARLLDEAGAARRRAGAGASL